MNYDVPKEYWTAHVRMHAILDEKMWCQLIHIRVLPGGCFSFIVVVVVIIGALLAVIHDLSVFWYV